MDKRKGRKKQHSPRYKHRDYKSNAKKIVHAGRNRWKIENQGFNRQKHWQGKIEHACSFHERVQKNHYLMEQIADFMKQLYEHFYLEKNEIKKAAKKTYLLNY